MERENRQFMHIFKGVVISLIASILLLIIFAILLTYTDIKENIINPVIIVITSISILMGSSIANIKIRKNGLLNGALIGLIYMAIIYLISSILNWKFGLNVESLVFILVGIICGILGGVIGVNKK